MARVKNGAVTKARHKKVLKQAKGYFGSKHRLYKSAKEQLMHSGQYAFRDRKQRKREFRKLWITRINAACRQNDISYSRFIEGLTKAGVEGGRNMARVKNGAVTKARHKKVLKQAKGYFGSKHRLYKSAKEQLMHSGQYAFRDRKQRKREFRKLWITRINAACRQNDISYSRFIEGLTKAGVEVNRKMLSEIAINDPKMFSEFVKIARDGKAGKVTRQEEVIGHEVTVTAGKGEVKEAKEEKKVEKKETKKEETKEAVDYSKMTVAELKEAAKNAKVEGYSTMKKAELVAALTK